MQDLSVHTNMWLPLICLFVITKIISALENEPKELLSIFIENLKQDPLLLDDEYDGVSQKSKRFIEHKVETFVNLLSQSQQSERSKRSLDGKNANNFINISPKNILSIKNADDIRLFQQEENHWFAVSLENQTNLAIYQYQNETFNKLLDYKTQYTTNLAVLPTYNLPLIAVGVNPLIKVLEFDFEAKTIEVLQTITANQPKHVVIWQEGATPYLSITETVLTESNIKIYKWLGRHFDHVQDIPVGNTKKTVPFNIHGSSFLAAVDIQRESRSYSEIFKFNSHSMQFELFQRLLTNGCTDIKYFTSELSGENHYFLVVVHSINMESVSVIYKYEDNYFIPFQTLTSDAIEWQPIEDLKGNAALIAISKNSLKGFQYNQWHFVETDIVTTKNDTLFSTFEDLRTIHTYNFNGEQILVIACDHCQNATNVFKVNFTNFNAVKDLYSQISSWCKDTLKEFEEPDLIVALTLRGDLNEQIPEEEDQKRQVLAALSQSKETIFKIEQALFPSDEELLFEDDFEADNIIFNNSAAFNSLEATSINALNVDNLFANILNIEKGFSLEDPMEFQMLTIKNPIEPEIVNKVPLGQYISLNSDTTIEKLTVNGSITFKQNLNVNNSINNIKISNKTLLLKSGDQIFAGNLTSTDLIAENLNINQISELKTLKVKHLVVGGYLNRVSIPVLVKRALKKSGNQVLDKPFSCDALEADSFNVDDGFISGKKVPDDFVLINSGEYVVGQDVEFLKDLKTNKFEVLSSLNNISVTDEGVLDILLSESPYVQNIPTRKTFENVIITNPINLRYKIRNAKMEQYNPVIIDDKSYEINKDVTINGLGEVTRWLQAQDLKPKDAQRSLGTILDKGLKLSDPQIPVHLNFTQPLNLDNTIADKVNSLNPLEWMLKSSNTTQIVKGRKTILGNVHLNGQLNASRINDVDVHALKLEVLRVAGDQEIMGNWEVDRVVAEKGISTNGSSNVTKSMEDIIVVNQTLTLDHLNITSLEVKGTINSKNMSNVLRNFVKKDAIIHKVFGEKTFKELHVDDLIIKDTNLLRLLNDVLIDEISLNKSLNLPNDVKVNTLIFEKNIINLSKENFDELMNLTNSDDDGTVIIRSDMEYDEITVIGDVFINDNAINGKNLSAIKEETVKVDEDHEFESGIIDGATHVDKFLNLSGNIENLDLNIIVEQNAKQLLKIEDKIFENHLNVNGTLSINKNVNGMALEKFCTFSEPNEQLKTLKIKGNVLFSKGPKILNINGESMKDLVKNVWFSDIAANISASVHLKNVTFNKTLNVSAFVDTINLDLLSENYLSKSKKQIISSSIAFTNVTFSNISTPSLKCKGTINGISIDDVLKSVLIQGEPQIFESTGYFEKVEVQNLFEDEYTVNNLSLKTDIMLYDQKNIVTGRKTIENLMVESLNLTHNVKIQKVDILDWLSNAVLTKGVIRVKEKKSFDMATFSQGLSLRGKFNGEDFTEENIMLVNMPQNITGKKTLFKSTQFKTLMVKGLVNNVDIETLVQNQTNRHENSTINSEIIFDNNVEAKNINVDILYDNINVTQLIANVTKLRNLDSFKGKFKDLLSMGMEIEGSLKDNAKLFKYYKEIIQFADVDDIFGLRCDDGIFRLVVFCMEYNQFKTFEWDAEKGTFVFSGEIHEPPSKPSFMQQVTLGDRDYLYIENPLQNYNDLHSGCLIKLVNPTTFEIVAEFHRTATISLISFVNSASQGCLGFIGNSLSGIDILCDENGYNYYWSQRIQLEAAYKATTLETPDSVYLFVARYGGLFKEPSIVIFQSGKDTSDFIEIQTIFERTSPNGLTAAFISNLPYVALSFGSQEKTVDSGWISIKKFDNNQFIEWRHIPLTTPQNVHFINQPSFEPLLLVPSADVGAPLHTFRYDGAAGFKEILKGSSLPVSSKIKVLGNGHFLATLQDTRSTGTILGAVVL